MTDPGYHIQSAGPNSTTAALAAGVPLESKEKQTNGDKPVEVLVQFLLDCMLLIYRFLVRSSLRVLVGLGQ
jgi:hypothetical protein